MTKYKMDKKGLYLNKGFYKNRISRLREKLDTKQLDLEIKCQALKENLDELEESRNLYAALYDFAPVGYVTLDYNGCIQEINLTGALLMGMEQSQLIGMPMLVFIDKADKMLFMDHLNRCRRANEKVITELSLIAKNGESVCVQLLSDNVATKLKSPNADAIA